MVEMPSDHMEAIFRFERNFNTIIPKRMEWLNGTFPRKDDVAIYTDGSKTDEATGAGVYC